LLTFYLRENLWPLLTITMKVLDPPKKVLIWYII